MSFGKPNYESGGFKKKNHFDLREGDVVARILPPFGSLRDKGVWHVFHAVHFGYKNMEGKYRPFASPLVETYDKETKTRTVKVADPALDRLNDLKDKLEAAKAEGNVPLINRLNSLVGFKGTFNLDKNQHMNVLLLDGTAGELKVRHKMFLTLKAEIDKLRSEGVDPLSLEDGRFFVFHKDGKGNETNFKVSVYTEKLDVPGVGRVERPVVSKVGPEVLSRLEKELFDLDTLFSKPTAEEVARIVATADPVTGKSPACDEIFDARWKTQRANSNGRSSENVGSTQSDTSKALSENTSTLASASGTQQTGSLLASTALPLGSVQAQAPAETTPKASESPIDEMSDEDFFKLIGNTNQEA